MCDPISITMGVLGVGQQFMAYQQAKSNVAFQNAQNDLQFQSQMLQAQSNRMTEDTREKMNDDFIAHTEFKSDLAYARASRALGDCDRCGFTYKLNELRYQKEDSKNHF